MLDSLLIVLLLSAGFIVGHVIGFFQGWDEGWDDCDTWHEFNDGGR